MTKKLKYDVLYNGDFIVSVPSLAESDKTIKQLGAEGYDGVFTVRPKAYYGQRAPSMSTRKRNRCPKPPMLFDMEAT